ncbi:uncharacterized protein LOC136037253 isoform X2 [Artemia franciscana]|uniref:BCL-6 corepressor n=1 Tax=Artemia franciscana TaxID=6661 RepID=A0AA88I1A8_ARTSF|nr:hypothetical protein QYM36_004834 [Artemia franciscana]
MDAHLSQFLDNDWQLLQVLGDLNSSGFNQASDSASVNPNELRFQDNQTSSFDSNFVKSQSSWKQNREQLVQNYGGNMPNGYNNIATYGNSERYQTVTHQPAIQLQSNCDSTASINKQQVRNGYEYNNIRRTENVQQQIAQQPKAPNKYQNIHSYDNIRTYGQPKQTQQYTQAQYQRPRSDHFLNEQYASRLESATQALNPSRNLDHASISNQLPNFNSFRQNQQRSVRSVSTENYDRQKSELPQMSDMSKIQQIQKWLQSSNPDDSLSHMHEADPVYATVNNTQAHYQVQNVRQSEVPRQGKPQQPKVSVDAVINQFKLERTRAVTNYQPPTYKVVSQSSVEKPVYSNAVTSHSLSQFNQDQRITYDNVVKLSQAQNATQERNQYQPNFASQPNSLNQTIANSKNDQRKTYDNLILHNKLSQDQGKPNEINAAPNSLNFEKKLYNKMEAEMFASPSSAPKVSNRLPTSVKDEGIQNNIQSHFGLKNAVVYGQDTFKVPESSKQTSAYLSSMPQGKNLSSSPQMSSPLASLQQQSDSLIAYPGSRANLAYHRQIPTQINKESFMEPKTEPVQQPPAPQLANQSRISSTFQDSSYFRQYQKEPESHTYFSDGTRFSEKEHHKCSEISVNEDVEPQSEIRSLDLSKEFTSYSDGSSLIKKLKKPKLMITEPPMQFAEQLDLSFAEDGNSIPSEGSVPIYIKENPQVKQEPQIKTAPKNFVQLYPNMVLQNEVEGEFVEERVEKVGGSIRDSELPCVQKSAEISENQTPNGPKDFARDSAITPTLLNLSLQKGLESSKEEISPSISLTPEPCDPEKPWNLACVATQRKCYKRPVIKNSERPLSPSDSYRFVTNENGRIPPFPCKKRCCVPLSNDSFENHKKMYSYTIMGHLKHQVVKAHSQNSTVPMKIVLSIKPPEPELKTPVPAHSNSVGKASVKIKEVRKTLGGPVARGRPRKPENLNKSPNKRRRGRKSFNVSEMAMPSTPVAQAALGLLSLTPRIIGSPQPEFEFKVQTPKPAPYKFKTKAELKQVQSDIGISSCFETAQPPSISAIPCIPCNLSTVSKDDSLPELLVKKKPKKIKKKVPELLVASESELYGNEFPIEIVVNKKYVSPPSPPPAPSETPIPLQNEILPSYSESPVESETPQVTEKLDVWDDMFSHSLENFCSELCHTGIKRVKRIETKELDPPVCEPEDFTPKSPASVDEELPLTARIKTKKPPKRKTDEQMEEKEEKGDSFYPGWEGELLDFKKSMRIPSKLISVPKSIPGQGLKIKITNAYLRRDVKLKRLKKKFGSGPSGFDYLKKKKRKRINKDLKEEKRSLVTPVPVPFAAVSPPPLDVGAKLKDFGLNKSIGETLLHKVARVGYLEGVAYLLNKPETDPSVKDNAGYTPLHEACGKGHLEVAHFLLMCGADVSASAQGGIRPLHEAAEFGNLELVRLLISYGADPNLGTYNGVTPMQLTSNNAVKVLFTSHLEDINGRPKLPWDFNIASEGHCGYDVIQEAPPNIFMKYSFEMSDKPLPRTSYCTTVKERHAILSDISECTGNSLNSLRKKLEAKTVRKDEFHFKYAFDTVATVLNFESAGFVEYNEDIVEMLNIETMAIEE